MAFRQGLHDAVTAYLVSRAATQPLVLGIEDVHWADPGTLDLTRHLVTRTRGARFSVVVTARPEGRGIAAALLDAADRSSLLDLGPLDTEAIAELAGDVLGSPASPALTEIVAARTSGNPLFVHQLLRSLVEMEALEPGPEGWRMRRGWSADAVPTGVEQVLAARIDLLPRPAADLLQVASVIGRDVLPALLRQVAGGDTPEHDEAVDLLVRGGFLDPVAEGGERRLSFHHALLVDVAYGRLLRTRQRELHRQVVAAATALLGTGDDVVDMLARHAYRGEMGAQAVALLERAGARAASLFANEQAVAYLRQAIEIAERDGDSAARLAALMLGCAQVEETRGAYREALDLYRRALARAGGLPAALGEASTLRKLGDYAGSLDVLAMARATRGSLPPEEDARIALEEGWVLGLANQAPRAIEVLRGGLAALQGSPNRRLEGNLLVMLARTMELTGDHDGALGHAERARRLLEEEGDLPGLVVALRVLGGVMHDAATDEAAIRRSRDTMEQALDLARRVGNAEEAAAALVNLGRILSALGSPEEALRCDLEAVDAFASVGLKTGVACAYCNAAETLGEMGRWQEAGDAAREGLAVAEEVGNAYWMSGAQIGIAESLVQSGDLRGAAAAGEAAFDLGVATAIPARAQSALRITLSALRSLGDAEAERRLLAKAHAAGVSIDEVAGTAAATSAATDA